jgi:hypothetical protein
MNSSFQAAIGQIDNQKLGGMIASKRNLSSMGINTQNSQNSQGNDEARAN